MRSGVKRRRGGDEKWRGGEGETGKGEEVGVWRWVEAVKAVSDLRLCRSTQACVMIEHMRANAKGQMTNIATRRRPMFRADFSHRGYCGTGVQTG